VLIAKTLLRLLFAMELEIQDVKCHPSRTRTAAVTGEHHKGGHWSGTFAVYLTTAAGLR
jgi:hypothetical protein